jgi:hypothetical protein
VSENFGVTATGQFRPEECPAQISSVPVASVGVKLGASWLYVHRTCVEPIVARHAN